jgi:hypothetical protein
VGAKLTKYRMLLNILDRLCEEARSGPRCSTYLPQSNDPEAINQARSRAYIHLYLKVAFGLLEFNSREHFVTDGQCDGGIDGYYIDTEKKRVYFIQSKFRRTESNFLTKMMTLDELLRMDLTRILEGHSDDEKGNNYNGKILQLQRELCQIEDVARYKYKVVILANLMETSPTILSRLFDGYPCEVIDYEASYKRLVFPVIAGTYFNASDLVIHLDLSNKNAGSKISYTVETQYGECDITVLFVPTLEIARTFHKYKNSILRFNPRSYLELEGQKVNSAIRNTILQEGKNEFALYNNGLTMISDETNLNEKIGQRNKARLNLTNPQIINGGQTAYTLSRIWEENEESKALALFEGKEVLLKVITVNNAGTKDEDKLKLIEAISVATNAQTPVINADRYSNEELHAKLQEILFDEFAILYERKRGEFIDGVANSYITRGEVIERNLLIRIFLAANGFINMSSERKAFVKFSQQWTTFPTAQELDRFCFGYFCFQDLDSSKRPNSPKRSREVSGKIYGMTRMFLPQERESFKSAANEKMQEFLAEWRNFIEAGPTMRPQYTRKKLDKSTMTFGTTFDARAWFVSNVFESDVKSYFDAKTT